MSTPSETSPATGSATDTTTETAPDAAPAAAGDPEAIQAGIERTRAELAETVDALQAKLDVKSRTKARVAELKDQSTTDAGKPRPDLLAGAAVAVLLLAGVVWWRRR